MAKRDDPITLSEKLLLVCLVPGIGFLSMATIFVADTLSGDTHMAELFFPPTWEAFAAIAIIGGLFGVVILAVSRAGTRS